MAVPLPMGEPGLHVVSEGAGHVVNLARPDAFNEALLDFLDACAARGR